MGLNIVKENSNMYQGWITHTWNTVKGKCYHDCSYCYMKRWGNQKAVRFDESELNTDLGKGNFIFVGSSNDLFSPGNDYKWIEKTLNHCNKYPENKYLFQTKNPQEMRFWELYIPDNSAVCLTLESNRRHENVMGRTSTPFIRTQYFKDIKLNKYITIEPILDFGLGAFVEMIRGINPIQVNIGADSGNNNLPEPSWDKVESLIWELSDFTTVKLKKNLDRLKQ